MYAPYTSPKRFFYATRLLKLSVAPVNNLSYSDIWRCSPNKSHLTHVISWQVGVSLGLTPILATTHRPLHISHAQVVSSIQEMHRSKRVWCRIFAIKVCDHRSTPDNTDRPTEFDTNLWALSILAGQVTTCQTHLGNQCDPSKWTPGKYCWIACSTCRISTRRKTADLVLKSFSPDPCFILVMVSTQRVL